MEAWRLSGEGLWKDVSERGRIRNIEFSCSGNLQDISPLSQSTLWKFETMDCSSTMRLFPRSSALGGEPCDPEGLGNRVEWSHLSEPNKTVSQGNSRGLLRAWQTETGVGCSQPSWAPTWVYLRNGCQPPPTQPTSNRAPFTCNTS